MRVKGDPIVSESNARHTENRGLPKAAQRRDVDTACGITHVVGEVDLPGLLHVASRERTLAEPRGHEAV